MLVLTPRQRQCWLLRSRGLVNKEIADVLGIALKTTEDHFTNSLANNKGLGPWAFLAEFVREQCRNGEWE